MEQSNIKVVVRVRPSLSSSAALVASSVDGTTDTTVGVAPSLSIDENEGTLSLTRDKRKGTLDFQFTNVLGPTSSQVALYNCCNLVKDVADGINCCIMAYGQTSSGKSYAMVGTGWEDDTNNPRGDLDNNTRGPGSSMGPSKSSSLTGTASARTANIHALASEFAGKHSAQGTSRVKKDNSAGFVSVSDSIDSTAGLMTMAMHGDGDDNLEGAGLEPGSNLLDAGQDIWPPVKTSPITVPTITTVEEGWG